MVTIVHKRKSVQLPSATLNEKIRYTSSRSTQLIHQHLNILCTRMRKRKEYIKAFLFIPTERRLVTYKSVILNSKQYILSSLSSFDARQMECKYVSVSQIILLIWMFFRLSCPIVFHTEFFLFFFSFFAFKMNLYYLDILCMRAPTWMLVRMLPRHVHALCRIKKSRIDVSEKRHLMQSHDIQHLSLASHVWITHSKILAFRWRKCVCYKYIPYVVTI